MGDRRLLRKGAAPAEALAAVQASDPHPLLMLTVFTSDPEGVRRAYAGTGYRPYDAAPLMSLTLNGASTPDDPLPVRLVETASDREFINSRKSIMPAEHLEAPDLRYYYIERDSQPVCCGLSVATSGGSIYVSAISTLPAYRRQGLASLLMRRLQSDAARAGMTRSVLCASTEGAFLYQALGYETVVTLQSFVPEGLEI